MQLISLFQIIKLISYSKHTGNAPDLHNKAQLLSLKTMKT